MSFEKKKSDALTRYDIISSVINKFQITRSDASELVEEVLEQIMVALASSENVKITGFGTFSVKEKGERIGRNPKTMEEKIITARKYLSFRPSPILKRKVNKD